MLIPAVHRVVYLTGEENWLSIEHRNLTVTPDQKVFFTLVLSLKNNRTELQLSSLARSIVQVFETRLTHLFETDGERDVESLIRKTITTLQEEQVEVDIVIAVQANFLVWLGATNGMVGIKRGDQYGQILQAFGEVVTANGQLIDGDLLILGSEVFTKFIAYKDIKALITQTNQSQLEEKVSQITQLLNSSPISAGAALISHAKTTAVTKPLSSEASNQVRAVPAEPEYFPNPTETNVGLKDFSAEKKKKTVAIMVVIVLLLVLAGSIGWRYQQQKRQAESERVASLLSPIEQLVSLAEEQQSINPLQARSFLFEAKTKIEQLQAETAPEASERPHIDSLASTIKSQYAQLSGEKEVTPELFFDLNLVKEGFRIDSLSLDEANLYALDKEQASVVWLGLDSKQSRVEAAGGSLAQSKLLSSSGGDAYVLTETGVLTVSEGQTTQLAPTQEEWQQVGGFGMFANRIYILDTAQGEIWRYQVQEENVVRQRWLAPGVTPEFTEMTDMVIDGDIWVLDKNGQVRQYTQGVSQGFSIQGLDVAMTDAVAITTTEDAVYVLDRSKHRVIRFSRDGVYQEQWLWPELAQASDMVSAEMGLLVSVGSSLYLFPY